MGNRSALDFSESLVRVFRWDEILFNGDLPALTRASRGILQLVVEKQAQEVGGETRWQLKSLTRPNSQDHRTRCLPCFAERA